MTPGFVRRVLLVVAILWLPAAAFAQEAILTGTVTDVTGAILPGVTVTAVHEATGNTFTSVTDERGVYRIAVRIGTYRMTADLQGFSSVNRTNVEVLVGQTLTIGLQMSPSSVQERVTVTAETPLLDLTTSSLGGNVDSRQIQELPVAGRNWMSLALLAPGSRTNPFATGSDALKPLPDRNNNEAREFQLNIDGQQVSADIGTGGQPRYNMDSIAEFQFVSNRFDATQGRSSGVQVNAITKSGTNQVSGLFRANFRNSRFNAEHPVFHRIEPVDNQQFSTTLGGPIVRDKVHYFMNFEYEREPRSSIWLTPYPVFNHELHGTNTQKKGGGRVDYQWSPQTRLMGKVSAGRLWEPFGIADQNQAALSTPTATQTNAEHNNEALAQLTQVLSNRALNEVKVGYAFFNLSNTNLTNWSNHWQKANGITTGSPRIMFTGFSVTPNQNAPRHQDQDVWSVRDDFSFSYDKGGRHDLRVGGEFLKRHQIQANCRTCSGTIDARLGPAPSAAQMAQIFPDPLNVDTWNLSLISPLVRSYSIGVGDFNVNLNSQKAAAWAQDDWQMTQRLTVNLGLRWDGAFNAFANDIAVSPFQQAGRPNEVKNFQPRVGFAYRLTDETVIRGGSGLYYGDALGADQSFATGNAQIVVINYANDQRPDFAVNPANGPLPTYAEALQRFCYLTKPNQLATDCLIRDLQEFVGPFDLVHLPRTWQTSIGLQRQLSGTMAFEADYIYSKGTHEKDVVENINLTYNPATGVNNPTSNRALRPYSDWGVVSMNTHLARSAYHALQTAFTKRYSDRWQASATYTLSGLWNADTHPFSGLTPVPFETAPDLGGEWGLSADDQRHRMVLNGIWQVGGGFQVSALHFFAAGLRRAAGYGGDLRGTGTSDANRPSRLRLDGTIAPRNAVLAPAQNKTDLRLQQRIPLRGRLAIDGIAEVFNIFNRPNYDIGITESQPSQYLKPVNGQYRTAQLGFRMTF